MTRVIKNTVDHVKQHDTKELPDLLMERRDKVSYEFSDALIDLELLVGIAALSENVTIYRKFLYLPMALNRI